MSLRPILKCISVLKKLAQQGLHTGTHDLERQTR